MKKHNLLVCAVGSLIIANFVNAQPINTWAKTFGADSFEYGHSVQQTSDTGYVVVGTTYSYGAGKKDIWLIKTNPSGDTLWTRTFGGSEEEDGREVQQTSDGGYIIIGNNWYGIWLIKTGASGDTAWTKIFYKDDWVEGFSVQQTLDGGYILTGRAVLQSANVNDVWLIKTSASGDTLWTKTFGGTEWDQGESVRQTSDSGYIIAGTTESYGAGDRDIWLIKTDKSGNTMWTKTFGGTGWDEGRAVKQTSDGGYIIVGTKESYGTGTSDIWLIKTGISGDTVWTRTFGGSGENEGFSVQQTKDNGYVVAGSTDSSGGWLVKTTSTGNTMWTKAFGDIKMGARCLSVQQTLDKGYILTGYAWYLETEDADVWVAKTDSLGNVGVEEKLNIKNQISKLKIGQNPFVSTTTIRYSVPKYTSTRLTIYDLSGRCVKTLVDGEKEAGSYSVNLNAKELKTGIYFVKLCVGSYKETKKIVLMK
ncbi:MAG: T9SS type A sorting domain-containing protein [bacterium]|nr:T9SS type A sorting domain-containing protein [bacterium]